MTKINNTSKLTKKLAALKQNKSNNLALSESNYSTGVKVNNTDTEEFIDGIKTSSEELQSVITYDYTGSEEPEVSKNSSKQNFDSSTTNWGLRKPRLSAKTQKQIVEKSEVNYTYSLDAFIATSRKVYDLTRKYQPCFD